MDDRLNEGGLTRRKALQGSLVVGGAVAIGGLAACGSSGSSSSGAASTATGTPASGTRKHGGTLRIAVNGASSSTVDAHIGSASDSASEYYVGALYDTLTKFVHQFKVQNHLAESLTPSKDLKTWTVKVRDGVTFHDGKPLTADDVIFSLKRIINPKNGSSGAFIIGSIDPHKLKKIDNRTVEIGLKYPDVSLPGGLAKVVQGIVPTNYNPKKPVGTGPFKLVSYNPTQRVVMARNPHYWNNPLPYVDQLVFVAFSDAGAITNAMTSNAVDGAGTLSAQQAATMKQNPNINVLVSKSGEFDPIVLRTDTGQFADPRVRQAMKLLIDRKQFVEQVYSGSQYGRIGNDMF